MLSSNARATSVSKQELFIRNSHLHHNFNSAVRMPFYHRLDPYKRLHLQHKRNARAKEQQ